MKRGTVTALNVRRGYFIVEVDQGDFSLFELLTGIDIAIGDRVSGNLNALGGEDLFHIGQQRSFRAFGQTGPSSLAACKRIM